MPEDGLMSTPGSQVGRPLKRVDGERKVTGTARYVADVAVPGILHARLVPSIYAHARINSIEVEEALASPGVVAVYTGRDIYPDGVEPDRRPNFLVALDTVRWYGQPVAVVLGLTEAAANDGAMLVRVDYTPLTAATDLDSVNDAPPVRERSLNEDGTAAGRIALIFDFGEQRDLRDLPANVTFATRHQQGDIEAGFATADVVVERTYQANWVHQGYMEPRGVVAVPGPTGGLAVYTSTQDPFLMRDVVALLLGLPATDVSVTGMEIGGGFGGKESVILEPLVGWLALRQRAPVKLVFSRSDEFLTCVPSPAASMTVKLGGTRDGRLTALHAQITFDVGCYPGMFVELASSMLGGYYRFEHLYIETWEALTHKPAWGAYRAPLQPQVAFAIEQALDELAGMLGWDPLQLRLKNAAAEGDLRFDGYTWPSMGLREVLEALNEHPLWQGREHDPGRGVGVAIAAAPGGIGVSRATVRLNRDGTVVLIVGMVDLSGSHTTMAALVAETLGLSLDRVTVQVASTDQAPFGTASSASRVTVTLGPAVLRAAEDAREQMLTIAASELEVSAEDLELADGRIFVRGSPERGLDIAKIAGLSMAYGLPYEPIQGNGAMARTEREPSFAGALAAVRVDPETGVVEVEEFVLVQDVGRALNPALVAGQLHGGAAQSVGWGLYEAMRFEDGQLLTATLMDYALPKATQLPAIETVVLEVPGRNGPCGARGIGESPVIPGAAAIANAVTAATGRRLTEMPMTSEQVLRALRASGDE
jgi:CO/xanthine dehydrogenase Mo-binding subunit